MHIELFPDEAAQVLRTIEEIQIIPEKLRIKMFLPKLENCKLNASEDFPTLDIGGC